MLNQPSIFHSPESPVLVIGASSVDLVGRLKTDLQYGTSNPSQIRSSFGGVARNVSENLARLGHPVTLVTAVGEDEIGERLMRQIASTGVEVKASIFTKNLPTGTYLAIVNSRGELQLALDDMRVVSSITSEYLRTHKTLFDNASMLFVDANLPKETLRTAFSLARKASLPICADPTSVSLAGKLKPHLSKLYLITPNVAEASILCDRQINPSDRQDALEAAKCLVSQGSEIAILTIARFGLCYATSETNGDIPAIRTEIVDPTGGGDALTAAVIFSLLNDIPIDDAVRLGVSAATLTLRSPGAVVPDLSLEKLYDTLVI